MLKEGGDGAGRVGTWRAVRLIVALGWSRICNRTVASISSAFGRGKKRNKGSGEQENSSAAVAVRVQGSPRRNRVGPAVGVILSCLVIFGITLQVSLFLSRMYRAVEERDGTAKAEVDAGSNLFARLKEAEAEMRSLAVQESLAGADAKLLREIGQRRSELVNRVRLLLTAEASDRPEGARFDPNIATRRFLAGGADALRGSEAKLEFTDPLPRRQAVFFGNRRGEILVVLGAALTLLVASALTMSLGVGNQDLGKVGWGTEWLFGFPVPATTVMVAKIGEYALFNFFGWIAFPLLTLVFVAAGFGWWSGLPGFVFALYLNALVGSGRVLVEGGLRRWLGVAGRKNAQAFFALLGSVLFFGFYALMASPELAGWFVQKAAQTGRDLPWWNPVSLPLHACAGGGTAALVGFACLGVGAAVVAGSAWICGQMVSGGLTGSGGARSGRRFEKGKGGGRCAGPRGAGGKEFLLLVRDRSVMVQVLVTPVLVLGFWLSLNLDVATGILEGFQHAATAAFVAAVYVLSYACLPSLKREGGGLWMLFSFPRSPSSILAGKARFWGFVGCLYAVPVLAWGFWNRGAETTASDVAVAAMVIAGIFLYAFIATAMGALATDPLAPRTNVPVDAKTAYLFMMLVALFVYGIYAPSAWTRLVQLVLCALLGYALWQRLRDALPYFFEPVESPPKRISLSHGLVATYSFFVFQGIGALVIFSKVPGLSPGASLLVSYVVAGLIVFVASVFILWRMEGGESVFRFPHVVKLGRARGILSYTVWVCGAAAVSVGVGLVYLKLSESVPGLQMLKEASMPSEGIRDLGDEFRWWFAGMAVIAAPLCEEFIFRGLVYRGLRRTAGMPMATLGSAALFALVHPPFSVFPVYVLGVVTAVAFEKTGRLIAPVMIHMAYNAAMISAQMGLW